MDKYTDPQKVFANADIYKIYDARQREWKHTTTDRILSGLMGNYQTV